LVEPEKGLEEWYRVVDQNGYMIITTPNNSMSWRSSYLKFFGSKTIDAVGHISEYDVRDLCKSLQKKSLEIHNVFGFNLVLAGPVRLAIVSLRGLIEGSIRRYLRNSTK
jgi:ubiquinone/menaquinone biosynthesis C-methylase UbiE